MALAVNSFVNRMPAGTPGSVTRVWNSTIETQVVTPSTIAAGANTPTAYGVPLVVDATAGAIGNMRVIQSGDTAVYGMLARPYPTNSSQDGLGVSTPPTSGPIDVLKSGYINVLLSGSTAAAKGGQVYVWTAAASGSHIVGGFEASNPGGSGIAYTGAYFVGPADVSGNTEIAINP